MSPGPAAERPPVAVERDGRVATLRLDRPPLNILDLETIAALDAALAAVAADPGVQVVVLRGAGERAFSAGVAVQDHTPDKLEGMLAGFHGAIRRLRDLAAVSIAAVDGHCLGGGLELAAACDLLLATDRSRFGQPEIQLGCYPPVAAALYPSRIGWGRSVDLLLTGRTLGAAEAERWGLAHRVVPAAELDLRLAELVRDLTAKSGAVARLTKRALAAGAEQPFEPALAAAERIYLEELRHCGDMAEGIAAFMAKRPAVWRHE